MSAEHSRLLPPTSSACAGADQGAVPPVGRPAHGSDAGAGLRTYTNVELLESLGQNSAVFAEIVRDVLAPQLEGLADALARSDAAFLDVGVGVAALSIAMCRVIPGLRAVGIDPWEVALELARRNVGAAGLDDRIELRRQAVEELEDESAFELAFLAGPFLGSAVIDVACQRVHAALRPGGWVLFGMYRGAEPLETALAHLRTARSGGAVLDAPEAERRLAKAGFVDVRTFAAELGIPSMLVAGNGRRGLAPRSRNEPA